MSNIITYDPLDGTVADRVTKYHCSANTSDYDGVTDKLVNPDLSTLSAVPQKYWKRSGSTVREMDATEKTAIEDEIKASIGTNEDTAKEDADTSRTDTTYTEKVSCSINVIEDNTVYEIFGYVEHKSTDAGTKCDIRIELDDKTVIGHISIHPDTSLNEGWGAWSFLDAVVLSRGVHTIDMDYKSTLSGKAIHVRRARLFVHRKT